jgi:hypothetical protein
MFVAWCSPRGRYCTLGFRCRCRGYSCDFHFSYQTLLSVFFLFFSFLFFFYYCAFLDQESYQQQMQLQQRCVVRGVSFYSFCLVLSWEVYYHILIYHIRISGRKNISNYGRYHFRTISVFPSVLDSSDSLSRRHSNPGEHIGIRITAKKY